MKKVLIAAVVAFIAAGPACDGSAAQSASKSAKGTATPATLDQLLAPIALYPDQLLAQILLCAADPGEVTALSKWLANNKTLKGTALQDAATVDSFEPSFVALTLFPQVVQHMADNIDWTTKLGKAFTADKTAVFASIQRLRDQAHDAGTLKTTSQQKVETKTTSSGEQVIVIEPANPQVIYVPQYNPTVVYTQPAPTTVVVDDHSDAVAAGLIGFTAGIALGAAFDNHYYYGPYGWHGGVYMYNDAWDDWYDAREDAREDWIDHREDLVEERGDRAENAREQRTERADNRQETRTDSQGQRTERQQNRQESRPEAQAQRTERQQNRTETRGSGAASYDARGYDRSGSTPRANADRSGTRSDAFSGYSSGRSERAASARGSGSRGSRGGGGGGRRR